MPAVEVRPGIYWIGVNDRTTDLFEGYWPIIPGGRLLQRLQSFGERDGAD